MKMGFQKKALFFIIVVLFNLAFAAGIAFLSMTISVKKLALKNLQSGVLKAEEKKQGISALENLLKNIGNKKLEIDDVFVEENKIIDFIESLENIAELANVKIEFRNADIPANSGKNASFPMFLFDIKGSFEAVFKFLKLTENLSYQINIQELGLSSESDSKKREWRANFKIQLLSFLPTLK